MITAFILTVSIIILGDTVTTLLQLPVPGPIIGLICTTVYFARRGSPEPAMARMFDGVIVYAPMLFVPAGVGVVEYLSVIRSGFWAITAVITLGTAATMLAAGLAMQCVLRARPFRFPASKHL